MLTGRADAFPVFISVAGHGTILSGESILPLRSKMNLANKNPESLIIKDSGKVAQIGLEPMTLRV